MLIGRPVKQLVKIDPVDGVNYLGVVWKHPGNHLYLEGFYGRYQVVGVILAETKDQAKKKKEKE
jgi:hypothetical protein